MAHLVPHLSLREVAQDLSGADTTQESCAIDRTMQVYTGPTRQHDELQHTDLTTRDHSIVGKIWYIWPTHSGSKGGDDKVFDTASWNN